MGFDGCKKCADDAIEFCFDHCGQHQLAGEKDCLLGAECIVGPNESFVAAQQQFKDLTGVFFGVRHHIRFIPQCALPEA